MTNQILLNYRIAAIIPCHNEEQTIAQVITQFKTVIPQIDIYVYDNCSTDQTAQVARQHGAIVRSESRQGKGYVVRRMFSDIDADIYIMVDGDITYDIESAPKLIQKLHDDKLDMVIGARCDDKTDETTYRLGHRFGNRLFNKLISAFFDNAFNDVLSGYRVFSRRFVKSFPALARGFDTEVELAIHALDLRLPVAEIPTPYYSRPDGSNSKLKSYRDGFKILIRIGVLLKQAKPVFFFGFIALVLMLLSIILAVPIFHTYFMTHTVPRLPTATLSASLMVLAFMSLGCGLILDNVARLRREIKYLHYLRS